MRQLHQMLYKLLARDIEADYESEIGSTRKSQGIIPECMTCSPSFCAISAYILQTRESTQNSPEIVFVLHDLLFELFRDVCVHLVFVEVHVLPCDLQGSNQACQDLVLGLRGGPYPAL